MEKLQLKHIAPYLPYGLQLKKGKRIEFLCGIDNTNVTLPYIITCGCEFQKVNEIKPILRPLSDLTKEIEVNEEKFVPIYDYLSYHTRLLTDNGKSGFEWEIINTFPYKDIEYLLEWHFDIFSLIEQGLAVDINTLND